MKRNAIRLLLVTVFAMSTATLASAQNTSQDEYPKIEVFVGYSALGENDKRINFGNTTGVSANYANTTGFETSITRNFTRHIGMKGDFSAHFNNQSGPGVLTVCNPTCTTATQNTEFKTRVYNFLAGPEFKARNSTRFTPFAYALGGVAHTSATFTAAGPPLNILLKRSDTGFAMALGGGLDIRATKKVSFRALMDYNPVFIQGSARDFVRISLGILIH